MNTFQISTKDGEVIDTQYYNFEDGRFFLKLPKSFTNMPEELLQAKYPANNLPTYAFSNENGTISVAINVSNASMKNEQIGNYLKTMEQELSATSSILETKTTELDGRQIGQIIFISPAVDTDIYNHMVIFSDQDQLVVVNFNCTKELQENWQEVGRFLMNSLMFPVEE